MPKELIEMLLLAETWEINIDGEGKLTVNMQGTSESVKKGVEHSAEDVIGKAIHEKLEQELYKKALFGGFRL